MNKYIIPVCDLNEYIVKNIIITANSLAACREKFMERYADYSDKDDWHEFIEDLDKRDILVGKFTDIETL